MAPARRRALVVVLFALSACAVLGWVFRSALRPYIPIRYDWHFAVSIYRGKSPLELTPAPGPQPLIPPSIVTDFKAEFVADPFLMQRDGRWWLFMEAVNAATEHGDIVVASSADAQQWKYEGIALDEPFHLSYPYVFTHEGVTYMLPESADADGLRLYRATNFPLKWQLDGELMKGMHLDPSVIHYQGRWWLFSTPTARNDTLSLFYADDLHGPWHAHPQNPIVQNQRAGARPGGRVLELDGHLVVMRQDCFPNYGRALNAFQVEEISPTVYRERPASSHTVVQATGQGWNAAGMHHTDAHLLPDGTWLASVDGYYFRRAFGFPEWR